MNKPFKILIIRLSSLGDILHTLPAFLDLRHTFPEAKIDWLSAKDTSFLLSAVKGIDSIHIFDKTALFAVGPQSTRPYPFWRLIRDLRREQYDYCIDFQGLLKTSILGFLSGASVRIGFPGDLVKEKPAHWFYNIKPALDRKPQHVLDMNRKLVECIGTRPSSIAFDPLVSDRDEQHVKSIIEKNGLSDFVVLNPGGGWTSKIWKPEYYGKLAELIRDRLKLQVVVTTGPGEEMLFNALAAHCTPPPPKHVRITFLQMIPLLKRARLLVGGDSGPLHLACILKTPVVGIFGPTSVIRNGPWSSEDEAVTNSVACSGCYKRDCPTDNACMDIPVPDLFAAIERRLVKSDIKPI